MIFRKKVNFRSHLIIIYPFLRCRLGQLFILLQTPFFVRKFQLSAFQIHRILSITNLFFFQITGTLPFPQLLIHKTHIHFPKPHLINRTIPRSLNLHILLLLLKNLFNTGIYICFSQKLSVNVPLNQLQSF